MKLTIFRRHEASDEEQRFHTLFVEMYPKLVRYAAALMTDADEARDIVSDVFERAWQRHATLDDENGHAWLYATDATGIHMVKPDFVGWSGLIPISMFIENIIGIVADGSANRITWRTDATSRHGISNLHFGHVTTTLIREGNTISVESTAPYTLVVNGVESQVAEGTTQILCQ